MAQRGLSAEFACPALPPLARDAIKEIQKFGVNGKTCLLGSSLGGFYATYLAEKHGAKAALINPAIDPHIGLRAYLGLQKNLLMQALSVAALALAAICTVRLVFASRRATLRQLNASLIEIAEQLKQLRPAAPK